MDLSDALVALVTLNAAVLMVQTIRVIATYGAIYSLTKDRGAKLLPLHVWIVAFALLGYVFTTTYFLIVTPDRDIVIRAVLYGTFGLMANYGLSNVMRYDRRKLTAATQYLDQDKPPEQ